MLPSDQSFDLTLMQYAQLRNTHPQAAKPGYAQLMRDGVDVAGNKIPLPALSRTEQDAGLVKFCLPAGAFEGRELETESVIIPMYGHHANSWFTLCVSSQVGCRMGCTFCETGKMGLLRNLTAHEIVRQRIVARELRQRAIAFAPAESAVLGSRPAPYTYRSDGVANIVFMGMGEPLDNLDAVTQAIRVLNDPAGLDFPMSQITVSTVGRIDGLKKLGELNWPNLRIAVSLNAPDDALRDQIMPINKAMPLADLQEALLRYPLSHKGRYLIEYVLLKGVNDGEGHAEKVAQWCRPLRCAVNVIPYNPQRNAAFQTPTDLEARQFVLWLKDRGIFAKRRVTHGRDLMGACGQLGNPGLRRKELIQLGS